MQPYVFFRQCLLLALITLLLSALGLSRLQTLVRAPGLVDAAEEKGRVTTLVTFETAQDAVFQRLPLPQRAAIVSKHLTILSDRIGLRQPPRRLFRFSRGVLLDLTPRQIRRLSRQPGIWQIEFNQEIAYEARRDFEPPIADKSIPPLEVRGEGFRPKISMAVVDTGLERFNGSNAGLINQACFCSRDGGCCPNGSLQQRGTGSIQDEHGHGTAVTNLALRKYEQHAGEDSSLGLVTIKILDDYPGICCPSDLAAAFDWLAATHPDLDVVNASLNVGARFRGWCGDGWGSNRLIADAVSAVQYNGTTVVAASGNEGSLEGMSAPACVPGVVSVGAVYKEDYPPDKKPEWGCVDETQNRNQVTCFSNSGQALDLVAPGAYLTAPWLNGSIRAERLHGTSFAAPQVAGCAAALIAKAPDVESSAISELLAETGTSVRDHRNGEIWPLLNCSNALRSAATLLDSPSVAEASNDAD